MSILDFALLNLVLAYVAFRFFLTDWALQRYGVFYTSVVPTLFLGTVCGALYLAR